MYYTKNENIIPHEVPKDYLQLFARQHSSHGNFSEILRARNDGRISGEDIKIAEMALRYHYLTPRLVAKLFEKEYDLDIDEKLEALFALRILNKFVLVEEGTETSYPNDGYEIYTLDYFGKILLDQYSMVDTSFWNFGCVYGIAGVILTYLTSLEAFLNLKQKYPDRLEYFRLAPLYRSGKTIIKADFEFGMKAKDGKTKAFVGIFPKGEKADVKKQAETFSEVFGNLFIYSKYFPNSVVGDHKLGVMVLAFSDKEMQAVADDMNLITTGKIGVYFTSLPRLSNGFEKEQTIFSYNPKEQDFETFVLNIFQEEQKDEEQ